MLLAWGFKSLGEQPNSHWGLAISFFINLREWNPGPNTKGTKWFAKIYSFFKFNYKVIFRLSSAADNPNNQNQVRPVDVIVGTPSGETSNSVKNIHVLEQNNNASVVSYRFRPTGQTVRQSLNRALNIAGRYEQLNQK